MKNEEIKSIINSIEKNQEKMDIVIKNILDSIQSKEDAINVYINLINELMKSIEKDPLKI